MTPTRAVTLVGTAVWASGLLLALAGCEDPVVVQSPNASSQVPTAPPPTGPGSATEAPDAGVDAGRQYTDDDFVEVDVDNRDPFRSFVSAFTNRTVQAPQRRVLLSTTSIDEMRLIAIISGVTQPRAMVVDPAGVGHVIKRGDYVGRPEVIQTGGAESMPVQLNWRVDRIKPNELVLTREDPTAPNRPPLTRVLPLNEVDDLPVLMP